MRKAGYRAQAWIQWHTKKPVRGGGREAQKRAFLQATDLKRQKKSPRSTTLQGPELLNSSLVWDENKERLSVPEIVGTRRVCKRQQCSAPDN
jgi:hypothetical protein